MSYALMLHPRWPAASFRRSLIDAETNKLVKTFVFVENEPQIVSDDEFAVLQEDVGKALVYAQRDADGNPIAKVDQFDDESAPVNPRGATFYRSDVVDAEAPGNASHDSSDAEPAGDEPEADELGGGETPAPEADDQPSRRNRRRR